MVMNKTKLLSIAVICLVLINLGMMSIILFRGKPPKQGHHQDGEGPKKIIIERLQFDDGQQKQYEVIINEHRSKTRELNKTSRTLRDELYSLLIENDIDKTKADSIMQTIAENQKAIDNLNFDHFQKIKAICKSSQLENFNGLALDLTHLFGPKNGPPK
jgi:Spy/CpxP family protein refolding chaperone